MWIIAGVLALALGVPAEASALTYLCALDGDAEFAPGLSASTTPAETLEFAFRGKLHDCRGDAVDGYELCAAGRLRAPSCLENQTEGEAFVICAAGCTATPGGTPACLEGEPVIASSFHGACAGAVCAGTNPIDRAFYAVTFDQETVDAAMAACNPVAPGEPLTSAHFSGIEGRDTD
jgi:hypothetical protein